MSGRTTHNGKIALSNITLLICRDHIKNITFFLCRKRHFLCFILCSYYCHYDCSYCEASIERCSLGLVVTFQSCQDQSLWAWPTDHTLAIVTQYDTVENFIFKIHLGLKSAQILKATSLKTVDGFSLTLPSKCPCQAKVFVILKPSQLLVATQHKSPSVFLPRCHLEMFSCDCVTAGSSHRDGENTRVGLSSHSVRQCSVCVLSPAHPLTRHVHWLLACTTLWTSHHTR